MAKFVVLYRWVMYILVLVWLILVVLQMGHVHTVTGFADVTACIDGCMYTLVLVWLMLVVVLVVNALGPNFTISQNKLGFR